MHSVFTPIGGQKMPTDHAVSTAELISNTQSIACPRITFDRTSVDRTSAARTSGGSSRLLNWVVALTERAQCRLARAAEAEAAATGMALDSETRFVNDAAGGGSRSIEAARSLRAH
jgi:cell division inhibitor SulA